MQKIRYLHRGIDTHVDELLKKQNFQNENKLEGIHHQHCKLEAKVTFKSVNLKGSGVCNRRKRNNQERSITYKEKEIKQEKEN